MDHCLNVGLSAFRPFRRKGHQANFFILTAVPRKLLKYCRNVANVKTLWYNEVVPKNRHPHLRLKHRRADAEYIRPETNPIQVSFGLEESIMKKLSKRFLTLAIACVMAMAMAVPAFAD